MKGEKEILHNVMNIDPKRYSIENFDDSTDNKLIFTIKRRAKSCLCPICKKSTELRQDLREEIPKNSYKHMVLSDKRVVELMLIRKYMRCRECKISFVEKFEIEAEVGNHTKLFENYVLYSWGHMTGAQIARNSQYGPWKIWNILKNINPESINIEGRQRLEKLDEIYLGIDEHSFSGHDMVLIITELKTRKTIGVLNDNKIETLQNRVKSLPIETQKKIKGLCTDMYKGYQNTVKKLLNIEGIEPVGVIDKYHLVQEANKMMDDVRQLNIWLLKMGYGKDDIINKGKITPSMVVKKNPKKKMSIGKNTKMI